MTKIILGIIVVLFLFDFFYTLFKDSPLDRRLSSVIQKLLSPVIEILKPVLSSGLFCAAFFGSLALSSPRWADGYDRQMIALACWIITFVGGVNAGKTLEKDREKR